MADRPLLKSSHKASHNTSRRLVLKGLLATSASVSGSAVLALPESNAGSGNELSQLYKSYSESRLNKDNRYLNLVNVHTQEKLTTCYFSRGQYVSPGLAKINHILRDFRANEAIGMDVEVVDFLYAVSREMATAENPEPTIQVLSGYRTQATNDMLRKRSGGVAKRSLHVQGRAIDFKIPDVKTAELNACALDLQRGGVGYYPSLDFVHIDSGNFRHWRG